MKQAEIAARLRYEIDQAELQRNNAIRRVGRLAVDPKKIDQRLRRADYLKAFWDGFEEGLKRSIEVLAEKKRNQRIVESAARS